MCLFGSADPVRNFLFVDDLVEIVERIIERQVFGCFACAHPNSYKLSELLTIANEVFGSSSEIHFSKEKKDIPSVHSEAMPKKCVTCHMYKEKEAEKTKDDRSPRKGGHTFRPDDRACLKCHEDPKPLVAEWQARTSSLIKRLKALLDSATDKTSRSYKDAKLNYDIVIADSGIGVHNPRYAQALLQYGISSLTAESVWKR